MPIYRAELIKRKWPYSGPLIHDVSQVLYLPFDKDHEPYSVESYDPTQVLRLPFEDPPQEITYDRSGHGNDGTIYGATRVIGKIRNALKFDGVDDYVKIAAPKGLPTGSSSRTIALWAKFDVDGKNQMVWWGTADLNRGCGFRTLATAEFGYRGFSFYFWGNDLMLSFNYLDGRYHHCVAWYSEELNLQRIYIDGELLGERTPTKPNTDYSDLYIGIRVAPDIMDGIIDELRIYNRALSQSEIKRLMNLRGV